MKYVLAYGLVIVLVRVCFWLGTVLVGFAAAGCLAWASEQLRGVVAGILSGLGGVAAAVGFGCFMFRLILGSGAFGLLPLLAATVSLIIPIRKDLAQARLLSDDVTKIDRLLSGHVPAVFNDFAGIAVGVKFRVVGSILGVVLTFLWFFLVEGQS